MKKIFSGILFFALTGLQAQTVSFVQAPGSPITNFSQQLGHLAVDLNADGFKDLITGRDGSSLSIFMGQGNGQFTVAPGPVLNIPSPISIASGYFNGDSNLDIATANYNGGTVSIWLGTGTGAFTPASGSPISTGSLPYCVDVADFNLDGNKDVIVVNAASNNVRLLLGNGAGSFTTAAGFPMTTGSFPYHVSAGFFNTDSYPDFAVVNGNGNTLVVFLGASNGVFTQASGSPYATGTQPRTIAVKDLNNDTYPDFVVSNALSNNINVFLGSANGSYANAVGSPISLNVYPFQSIIADINLDGQQDIATVNGQSDNITILYGNGTGAFIAAPGSPISVGSYPHSLCSADFDNDNRIDLATGDWSANKMNVLINKTPVNCGLSASFSYSVGVNGSLVFTSTSTGTVANTTYSWNFGDNTTGTGNSNTHVYANAGVYTVTLTANNNFTSTCQSSVTMTVSVSFCNISPSFIYSVSPSGLVNFTSTATGTVPATTLLWNFGNGFMSTLNPVNSTYLNTGVYTVTLTVNNNSSPTCQASTTMAIFISICNLIPSYTYTVAPANLINFASNSTGTISTSTFQWSFGDGFSSALNPVSHTYVNAGTYVATLTINNNTNQVPACTGSTTHTIIIDKGVGFVDLSLQNNVSVSPNPTSGQLRIVTENVSGTSELVLYNALGQESARFELRHENTLVNLQNLKNGTYHYNVLFQGHVLKSGKVVLNK